MLEPDAFELYNYQNQPIQLALQEAKPSIMKIISQKHNPNHPIVHLYSQWSKTKNKPGLSRSFQNSCFNYHLLPGNASLASNAAVDICSAVPAHLLGLMLTNISFLAMVKVLCDLVVI